VSATTRIAITPAVPSGNIVLALAGSGTGAVDPLYIPFASTTLSGPYCAKPNESPQSCQQNFGIGSVFTLLAVPTRGSRFAGWTGACTGSNPTCVVQVGPGSRNITATFAAP
jgi:uncharacterized repeat protein (TIGR02543 family)